MSDLEMVLTINAADERIRKVVTYRKIMARFQMVMFFKEPADVKDTGFLAGL